MSYGKVLYRPPHFMLSIKRVLFLSPFYRTYFNDSGSQDLNYVSQDNPAPHSSKAFKDPSRRQYLTGHSNYKMDQIFQNNPGRTISREFLSSYRVTNVCLEKQKRTLEIKKIVELVTKFSCIKKQGSLQRKRS